MKGAICFFLFFLLITPKSRQLLSAWIADSGKWINAWAPFSYFILMFLVVATVAAVLLMVRWPKAPEPENPLAKYKYDDTAVD